MNVIKKCIPLIVFTLFISLVFPAKNFAGLEAGSGDDGYEQEADRAANSRPNPMRTTPGQMSADPYNKHMPLFDTKGQQVNLQNKKALEGKPLFDKMGNAYQFKNGQLIKTGLQKKMTK